MLWLALTIAGCVGLAWIATKIEPHWVSRDGRRFLCNAQLLNGRGEPQSRWRETRVIVTASNQVQVDQKRLFRRTSSFWKVTNRSDSPPRGKEVFLFSGFDESGAPALLAVRLPKKSRAVPALAALVGTR